MLTFGATKCCVCWRLTSSWYLNTLSPVIGGRVEWTGKKQHVPRCVLHTPVCRMLLDLWWAGHWVPPLIQNNFIPLCSKGEEFSEPAGCHFSPAHCSMFSLHFWSIEGLFCFYTDLCLLCFLSVYFVFHCCVGMCYREMSQGLNQLCHLDLKS